MDDRACNQINEAKRKARPGSYAQINTNNKGKRYKKLINY